MTCVDDLLGIPLLQALQLEKLLAFRARKVEGRCIDLRGG
jgi:hypothetical protein